MNNPFIQKLNKILTYIFIACLIIYGWTYFKTETLPTKNQIKTELLSEPLQTQTLTEPFTKTYDDQTYSITPKYDYEIYGLVVSYNDLDEKWYNIYYDNDPYNIKDVCVIWGDNLSEYNFQKVKYWSGTWTCYFQYQYKEVPKFNHSGLSNNHLLPASTEISKKMKRARRGDQIYIKGHLVDYSLQDRTGKRTSSTTRQDTGQGACEVIYVTEFKILKSQNQIWRLINHLSFALGVLTLALKGYVFVVY